MTKTRIIARLDIKNEYVIKGICLEGLRKIGDPNLIARKYYEAGIDEILFMDAVASLYGRNTLFNIIEKACVDVLVPIIDGGGIRSIYDIEQALKVGADKVSINSQALKTPELISEAAKTFGSQCIVGSIEAKKQGDEWEAYIDGGRERTGINAVEWAKRLESLGIGEILITSVDCEGTKKGFDKDLVKVVTAAVSVPVIASGGAGNEDHVYDIIQNAKPDGVALASLLHYNLVDISDLKRRLSCRGVMVRI